MTDYTMTDYTMNDYRRMFNRQPRRGRYGYAPLNESQTGYHFHHLHLENDHSFGIFVPYFLHDNVFHDSSTWQGMDSMNAIAWQYFLDDELYVI